MIEKAGTYQTSAKLGLGNPNLPSCAKFNPDLPAGTQLWVRICAGQPGARRTGYTSHAASKHIGSQVKEWLIQNIN